MDTKEEITEAARTIYINEGYAALSMRKIAKVANVSAMAAYRHFENKEALVIYMLKKGFMTFEQYLLKSLDKKGSLAQFRESGYQYLEFALDHPHYYKLMFVDQEFSTLQLDIKTQQQFNRTFQFLVDRVRACMYEKLVIDGDPEALAAHIWAHVHGLTSLFLTNKMHMDQDQFKEYYKYSMDLLVNGLKIKKI